MVPYVLEPGSHLPLASFSSYFRSSFKEWPVTEPPNERYLAFFYINDIWQLERANYANRPESSRVPYVLERAMLLFGPDLRSGKCHLVLDMSGEGHPYNHQSFLDLHEWCSLEGIPLRNISFISQNRVLGEHYAAKFGSSLEAVHFFYYDEFVAGTALYLASSNSDFERRFGFSKSDRKISVSKKETKKFLCLNATPRPVRLSVLAAMDLKELLKETLWSLLKEDSGKGSIDPAQILALLGRFGLAEAFPYAERLLASPPRILDKFDVKQSNTLIYKINLESYNSTFMSVVTETDFSSGEIVRVTEKTIKALAMGHPIIIFGNSRSLSLVREFGFQSFSPIIDETYDVMLDPKARFNAVLDQITKLNDKLTDEYSSDRMDLTQIARSNLEHAFSGTFYETYEKAVAAVVVDGLKRSLV